MSTNRRTIWTDDLSSKHRIDFQNTCKDCDYNAKKELATATDFNVFNQNATEAMVYYFLKSRVDFSNVSYDVHLCKASGSDKNIDVAGILENRIKIRIEVKTPVLEEPDGRIHGKIAFRAANNLEAKNALEESRDSVINSINNETDSEAVSDKLDDLKIKTYLENANEKFGSPSKDDEINILFVGSDTSTILNFIRYYTNPLTGVFSNDPYFKIDSFLNIDFIVFSNCSECHLDDGFTFNCWDLNNFLCFVLPLNQRGNSIYNLKRMVVDSVFSSKLYELSAFQVESDKQNSYGLPIEFWSEVFVAENYPHFNCNIQNRKYK